MNGHGRLVWSAIVAGTLALTSWAVAAERPLQVMTLAGQGETQRSGAGWAPAMLRGEVQPGDAVRTLTGRLTLVSPSGQAIRLAPSSRIVLLDSDAPDQPTRVRLDGGAAWAAVRPGSPVGEQVEILTRSAAIRVRGSGVGVAVASDGSVLVRVYHGTAECAGVGADRPWTRALVQGQELV